MQGRLVKRGTPQHPKTLALASLLGVSRCHAVGVLEGLWHFAGAYARRGDVGRHSDQAIALGIGWEGDPGQLVHALVDARWLDRCECHRLRVHDWPAHADQAVRKTQEVKDSGFADCYGAGHSPPEASIHPPDASSTEGGGRSPSVGIRQTAQGTGHRAPADGNGRARPANPLVAGRRADLERELQALVRAIGEREGLDPTEVVAQLSEWNGRSYINPAAMPDDRLAHTLRAARKRAAPETGGVSPPREPSEADLRPYLEAAARDEPGWSAADQRGLALERWRGEQQRAERVGSGVRL